MCSLERFHSLQDKFLLLDEAVALHDGNVITAVSPVLIMVGGGNHLTSISVYAMTFILLFS